MKTLSLTYIQYLTIYKRIERCLELKGEILVQKIGRLYLNREYFENYSSH